MLAVFHIGDVIERRSPFAHRLGQALLVPRHQQQPTLLELPDRLAEARDPMTNESDFMRYFVNVPTKREAGMFVKASVWNGLADEEFEIAEEADVCLGMDGSRTFDTTVVAWAEQREDGTIAVDACVFSVRVHVAHHILHEGGKIDF